jgi:hypothetical protein
MNILFCGVVRLGSAIACVWVTVNSWKMVLSVLVRLSWVRRDKKMYSCGG